MAGFVPVLAYCLNAFVATEADIGPGLCTFISDDNFVPTREECVKTLDGWRAEEDIQIGAQNHIYLEVGPETFFEGVKSGDMPQLKYFYFCPATLELNEFYRGFNMSTEGLPQDT